jgi:hypothetical protein
MATVATRCAERMMLGYVNKNHKFMVRNLQGPAGEVDFFPQGKVDEISMSAALLGARTAAGAFYVRARNLAVGTPDLWQEGWTSIVKAGAKKIGVGLSYTPLTSTLGDGIPPDRVGPPGNVGFYDDYGVWGYVGAKNELVVGDTLFANKTATRVAAKRVLEPNGVTDFDLAGGGVAYRRNGSLYVAEKIKMKPVVQERVAKGAESVRMARAVTFADNPVNSGAIFGAWVNVREIRPTWVVE